MASTTCGWCAKATHMTPIVARSGPLPKASDMTQVAYQCDNCFRFNVAWADGKTGHTTDTNANDQFIVKSEDAHWLPRIGLHVVYDDVPPDIASAASEAHECFSIGARRAAIIMARAVIEASAKEHSITSGSLFSKVDEMVKRGIIRPLIAEAAHGIRDFGNDMAHGDFGTAVSDQDVEETLNLMAVVLSEVFQIDARTKALRERVKERKAETSS